MFFGYLAEIVVLVVVTKIINNQGYVIIFSGDKKTGVVELFWKVFEDNMKILGCNKLSFCSSRKGWVRRLKHLGWELINTEDSKYILMKDI